MTSIEPITLTGKFVTLEPLRPDHHDNLVEAAKDGELWKLWYTSVPTPDGMAAEIERRLGLQTQGSMVPFATRLNSTGRVIGMTTYMNIDAATPRVEIGSTWNAASAHGTGTNPDSKLLLLRHALKPWAARRWSSARTGSTSSRAMRLPGSAPSRTVFCGTTPAPRTECFATPWCFPSSSTNGRRCGTAWSSGWPSTAPRLWSRQGLLPLACPA